jgi:hypothetical protein
MTWTVTRAAAAAALPFLAVPLSVAAQVAGSVHHIGHLSSGSSPGTDQRSTGSALQDRVDAGRRGARAGVSAAPGKPEEPKEAPITLAAAAERYLGLKARKRTIAEDRRTLEHLKAVFGETMLLTQIAADRVSTYKAQRLAKGSAQ